MKDNFPKLIPIFPLAGVIYFPKTNLPLNILVGAEGFLATKADEITGNATYWAGLGIRMDYSF